MTIQEVYDYGYRNWAATMDNFGLGRNTYQYWLRVGYIPMPMQLRIEKITNGELKADVNKAQKDAS